MSNITARALNSAFGRASKTGFRSFASGENLVKTAMYDLHKELGGEMVPFAGYELPVFYKGENAGVLKEHLWCRGDDKAALFDGECYNGKICS
jgi:hypothetical protein